MPTQSRRRHTVAVEHGSSRPADRTFLPWASTDVASLEPAAAGVADGFVVDWQMLGLPPVGPVVPATPEL